MNKYVLFAAFIFTMSSVIQASEHVRQFTNPVALAGGSARLVELARALEQQERDRTQALLEEVRAAAPVRPEDANAIIQAAQEVERCKALRVAVSDMEAVESEQAANIRRLHGQALKDRQEVERRQQQLEEQRRLFWSGAVGAGAIIIYLITNLSSK
jgi:hypothetical protein